MHDQLAGLSRRSARAACGLLVLHLVGAAGCRDHAGPTPADSGTCVGAAGCRDHAGPTPADSGTPAIPGLIVSHAVASSASAQRTIGTRAAASSAGGDVVYVSMAPGSVPTGLAATIRNLVNGQAVTVPLLDGGFDPVGLAATVGDTLTVDITRRGAADALHGVLAVRAHTPPLVVRTDPPPKKRDVPLNSVIVIVFSEPIDSGSLDATTVRLLGDGAVIPGSVKLGAEPWLVELVPAQPLAPQTDYQLEVAASVRATDGTPLGSPLAVGFATAAVPPTTTTGYLIWGSDMGPQHQNLGVHWGASVVRDPIYGDWVQGGQSITVATVTVNGEAIPYRLPGVPFCCTGDNGTTQGVGAGKYQGRLPARVPDGDTLRLDVSVDGIQVHGTATVPEAPRLTAPVNGAVLAQGDLLTITWTSATNPDRFSVAATWVVGQTGYGRRFPAPAGARQLTILASALPLGVQVDISVFSYNDGTFTGPASPESRMSIRGECCHAWITVSP